MRWPRLRPVALAALLAGLAAGAGAGHAGESEPNVAESVAARRASVDKTIGLLDTKWADRSHEVERRVRALYKLSRAGQAGLWLDPAQRSTRVHWRTAARRILARDVRELALLREERAVAERARLELGELTAPDGLPERRSLMRPVPGTITDSFGTYRHDGSRARLSRRGALLRAREGDEVHAVEAGVVRFTGELRGLGQAVLIDHGSFTSVVGRLRATRPAVGRTVARGAVIGTADGTRVYLEIRLDFGPGGEPVDPAPLLLLP